MDDVELLDIDAWPVDDDDVDSDLLEDEDEVDNDKDDDDDDDDDDIDTMTVELLDELLDVELDDHDEMELADVLDELVV